MSLARQPFPITVILFADTYCRHHDQRRTTATRDEIPPPTSQPCGMQCSFPHSVFLLRPTGCPLPGQGVYNSIDPNYHHPHHVVSFFCYRLSNSLTAPPHTLPAYHSMTCIRPSLDTSTMPLQDPSNLCTLRSMDRGQPQFAWMTR